MKYTEKKLKELLLTITILVDSREKMNSHITEAFDKYNIQWKKYKLDFGDYSVMIPKNDELGIMEDTYYNNKIAVERKNSLNEIGANISTNRDRFKREFERCEDGKIILMIENNTYEDIVKNNYDNKIEPNSFLAMLHSLSIEYDVPFMFIKKEVSFVFIYKTFYYFLRNELKKEID